MLKMFPIWNYIIGSIASFDRETWSKCAREDSPWITENINADNSNTFRSIFWVQLCSGCELKDAI